MGHFRNRAYHPKRSKKAKAAKLRNQRQKVQRELRQTTIIESIIVGRQIPKHIVTKYLFSDRLLFTYRHDHAYSRRECHEVPDKNKIQVSVNTNDDYYDHSFILEGIVTSTVDNDSRYLAQQRCSAAVVTDGDIHSIASQAQDVTTSPTGNSNTDAVNEPYRCMEKFPNLQKSYREKQGRRLGGSRSLRYKNCSVTNCVNASCRTKTFPGEMSQDTGYMFHFPRNIHRARAWALACGRLDFLHRLKDISKSYYVCRLHFEERMFKGQQLKSNAVPIIFPSLTTTSTFNDTSSENLVEEEAKEKPCRLCLEDIRDGNHKVIMEGIHIEMLKVLYDLSVSDGAAMCNNCAVHLQKCFDFKIACLTTEDCVKVFAVTRDSLQVKLKDVLLQELSDDSAYVGEGDKICRLCFNLNSEVFTTLDVGLMIVLKRCLPEVNLNLTDDPVICSVCLDLLKQMFGFAQACPAVIKVETPLNELRPQVEAIENDNYYRDVPDVIKLNFDGTTDTELQYKVEDIKCEPEEVNLCNDEELPKVSVPAVKVEIPANEFQAQIGDLENDRFSPLSSIIKVEGDLDGVKDETGIQFEQVYIEEEGVNDGSDPLLDPISLRASNMAMHEVDQKSKSDGLWKCEICTYHTRYFGIFNRHKRCHEGPKSEFQCASCPYKGTRRSYLKSHMARMHIYRATVPAGMIKCLYCEFYAKHLKSISMHMAASHATHAVQMLRLQVPTVLDKPC